MNLGLAKMQLLNFLRHRGRRGLPTALGIELSTACNRSCSYCPQSLPGKPKQTVIQQETWHLFLKRLREFDWRGMVGFHRFGEPTLVPDFHRYVRELKLSCPASLPYLFSNGDRPEVIRKALLEGLTRALITEHEGTDHARWYRPLRDLQDEFGRSRVRIRKLETYGNHAGTMTHIEVDPLTRCDIKSSGLGFTVDGIAFMCCEDAKLETAIWGSLVHKRIDEIWFNPHYVAMRRSLASGTPKLPVCKGCFGIAPAR